MPSRLKAFRHCIPILGMIALLGAFLKLPEVPNIFGSLYCKSCFSNSPYLSLLGAGYFTLLIATALLFPIFPNRHIARGGWIWATLLGITLTYMNLPNWCIPCLISHLCHILIWTIWLANPAIPSETEKSIASPIKERVCLMLFGTISMVALFTCLNLTFLIYGLKQRHNADIATLQPGDLIPPFRMESNKGVLISHLDSSRAETIIINFITPNCPFCNEQLSILNSIAPFLNHSYRLINVTPILPTELVQKFPTAEWMEDKEEKLRKLFKVEGYPTLFVLGNNDKITRVILGASDELKELLDPLP